MEKDRNVLRCYLTMRTNFTSRASGSLAHSKDKTPDGLMLGHRNPVRPRITHISAESKLILAWYFLLCIHIADIGL